MQKQDDAGYSGGANDLYFDETTANISDDGATFDRFESGGPEESLYGATARDDGPGNAEGPLNQYDFDEPGLDEQIVYLQPGPGGSYERYGEDGEEIVEVYVDSNDDEMAGGMDMGSYYRGFVDEVEERAQSPQAQERADFAPHQYRSPPKVINNSPPASLSTIQLTTLLPAPSLSIPQTTAAKQNGRDVLLGPDLFSFSFLAGGAPDEDEEEEDVDILG